MLLITAAVLLSVLGAYALQQANYSVDHGGAFSIGGYPDLEFTHSESRTAQ